MTALPTLTALLLVAVALLGGCPVEDTHSSLLGTQIPGPDMDAPPAPSEPPAALGALPYLNWLPVEKKHESKKGVTLYRRGVAKDGLNFYNSRPRHEALLMDMSGTVLHRWSSDAGQPGPEEVRWFHLWPALDMGGWHHSELLPDGSILCIVHHHSVLKLDPSSRIVWKARVTAHHDLDVADNGDIYVLDAQVRPLTRNGKRRLFVDNGIVVLSADGRRKKRISLLDLLMGDPSARPFFDKALANAFLVYDALIGLSYHLLVAQTSKAVADEQVSKARDIVEGHDPKDERLRVSLTVQSAGGDLLHANTLEILKQDIKGFCKKGDILVSVRNQNLVLVLDLAHRRVRWAFGPGVVTAQHQPSLLPDGKLLVFDNGPLARGSRVLEVDPLSRRIIWSYQGTPPQAFYSAIRGGCQGLTDGHVLITESEKGRVFEVTRTGELCWEFYNPDIQGRVGAMVRAPIYRMTRVDRAWLRMPLKAQGPLSTSPAGPPP